MTESFQWLTFERAFNISKSKTNWLSPHYGLHNTKTTCQLEVQSKNTKTNFLVNFSYFPPASKNIRLKLSPLMYRPILNEFWKKCIKLRYVFTLLITCAFPMHVVLIGLSSQFPATTPNNTHNSQEKQKTKIFMF